MPTHTVKYAGCRHEAARHVCETLQENTDKQGADALGLRHEAFSESLNKSKEECIVKKALKGQLPQFHLFVCSVTEIQQRQHW